MINISYFYDLLDLLEYIRNHRIYSTMYRASADLYFMPMLACTTLPPNANFGLSDWSCSFRGLSLSVVSSTVLILETRHLLILIMFSHPVFLQCPVIAARWRREWHRLCWTFCRSVWLAPTVGLRYLQPCILRESPSLHSLICTYQHFEYILL